MTTPVVVLGVLNLASIAILALTFFKRGRLNVRWWLTTAPFAFAALVLVCGLAGVVAPVSMRGEWVSLLGSIAAVLLGASFTLMGVTLGTHERRLSLWHQDNDAPRQLVTRGPYARVRHPFYLSYLMGLLGCVAAFPHWATAAAWLFALLRLNLAAAGEERLLASSSFGHEYREYMRRTRRFWPGFLNPRSQASR